jgi:hypothetical protein
MRNMRWDSSSIGSGGKVTSVLLRNRSTLAQGGMETVHPSQVRSSIIGTLKPEDCINRVFQRLRGCRQKACAAAKAISGNELRASLAPPGEARHAHSGHGPR